MTDRLRVLVVTATSSVSASIDRDDIDKLFTGQSVTVTPDAWETR